MVLTPEQVKSLKEQLKKQVSNLPEDQKASALKQIDEMSSEAIEAMLNEQKAAASNPENSIFRKIVKSEVPSTLIGENNSAIAVLSLLAISKGHSLIIPKEAVTSPDKIPQEAFQLAEALTKKLMLNLKPNSVKLHTEMQFGEAIINLIPIYDEDLDINSEREQQTPESLAEIKRKLETIHIQTKEEELQVPEPSEQTEQPQEQASQEDSENQKPKKEETEKPKVYKLSRKIP